MSVVNRMLRDLDRRQAAGDHRVFAQQLRPVDERRRGAWIAIGIAVLAAGGVGLYAFSTFERGAVVAPPPGGAIASAEPVTAPPPRSLADANTAAPALSAERQETGAAPGEQPKSEAPPRAEQPIRMMPRKETAVASAPARTRSVPAETPVDAEAKGSKAVALAQGDPAPSSAARPAPVQPVTSASAPNIDKRFRESPARSAEAEFRRAAALLEQGRIEASLTALRACLALNPEHEAARQTLAALTIESRAFDEADEVLKEGLRLNPAQSTFAIALARLMVDRGDTPGALALLREYGAPAAAIPEYRAFVGALLQRLGRHAEAIDEYQAALQLAPGVGAWWIGLGIAQEGADRPKEAAEAFRRAKASGTLPAELADFVDRKLLASAR